MCTRVGETRERGSARGRRESANRRRGYSTLLENCLVFGRLGNSFKMVLGAMAAVAATQLLGALWYSPFCLGIPWMRAVFPNRTKESIAQEAGPAYAIALASSAGIAVLLHIILVSFFQVKTVMDAVKFTVGLASLTTLVDAPHLAFSKRSLTAYIIDHLYDAVSLVIMAACIFYLG